MYVDAVDGNQYRYQNEYLDADSHDHIAKRLHKMDN